MDNLTGLVGQTIGKYRIVEHLGRGGMAEVYKGYQANLDRYVALKLMHAFLATDPDFSQRFEREAKNVAALRHPNIVQVYDYDVHNAMPFMVMEFIEGGTLKTYLEQLAHQGKVLPISEAIHIIYEVGEALAYAHQRNMIHRDIKPANVMMDTGGRVILTDFGIAKILTGPSYTATGSTVGTPSYMSPEQSLGKAGDHRSDIYSLGVMLYQLATGQLPYDADTPLAVMLKHVNEPLPMPHVINPNLPEGVERIILKSMAKNPDDRFQSAEEMLSHLRNLDAAANIAIPPASMAAGRESHANTVAAKTRLSTEAAMGPTIISRTGAGGATAAPEERKLPMPLIIGGVVGALVLLVCLGALLTGGFGLFPAATATLNPEVTGSPAKTSAVEPGGTGTPGESNEGTPTPNLIATERAANQMTLDAIIVAIATHTPTGTPDATQTAAACVFDYALAAQNPADGRTIGVGIRTTKSLTIENTGSCDFPAGTMFSETSQLPNVTPVALELDDLEPEETQEVSFDWAGLRQSGTMTRVFGIYLPTGLQVGEPLTLTLKYTVFATATPVPTATPNIPPSPTRGAALTRVYPQSIIGCNYVNAGMDYDCTVRILWEGGTGRMTLYYEGTQVDTYDPSVPGDSLIIHVINRRCFLKAYSLLLIDDGSNTQATGSYTIDPARDAGSFPNGSCTLP